MRRRDELQRAKENQRKNEALTKADAQYPLFLRLSNDLSSFPRPLKFPAP
jgi:hypothetical protein